jgi:hypothetical protein
MKENAWRRFAVYFTAIDLDSLVSGYVPEPGFSLHNYEHSDSRMVENILTN